jgi:hypothetical protein
VIGLGTDVEISDGEYENIPIATDNVIPARPDHPPVRITYTHSNISKSIISTKIYQFN